MQISYANTLVEPMFKDGFRELKKHSVPKAEPKLFQIHF